MAIDTTGTHLKTTAVAASRAPSLRFRVDWADQGFDYIDSWTEETDYVVTVRGDSQATDWTRSIATIGRGVADVCYVTCRNPDQDPESIYSGLRFSSSNASGPLYAYLGAGKIHMKRAYISMGFDYSGTPERLRQIVGYIVNVTENYNQRTVTFEIRDRGADCALTTASTALYSYDSAQTYMQALVGQMERDPVATADQVFDKGMVLVPYQWCEDDNLWTEMSTVAEAQLGRIWFDKSGDLHFDDGAHFVKSVGEEGIWDDPTVSQASFTTASFADCQPQWNLDGVFNDIVVEYTPRYVGERQTVYDSSETLVIRPESTLAHKAEMRYPLYDYETLTANTDYVAVTGGGTDITSDVTVTVSNAYAAHMALSVANASEVNTAYLVRLQIRGRPLLASNMDRYATSDSTSIGLYGKRTWVVRNPYVQAYRHAQLVGDFLLSRYKDPIMSMVLKGVPARPWLEVGDRITVTEALTGINEDFFIGRLEWQFDGRQYTQNMHLMRVSDLFPYSNYFQVGVDPYGKAARLFW